MMQLEILDYMVPANCFLYSTSVVPLKMVLFYVLISTSAYNQSARCLGSEYNMYLCAL